MIQTIITWLESMAQAVPLPIFVMIGGIVEEIIAPIPSPLVATLAGSITASQHLGIPYLLWICLLATVAKTVGAWVFFFVGQKLGDFAIPRFGKYFGVQQKDIEYFGRHFRGTSRDVIVLTIIRAIPVMPSTPISLACGILKIPQRTFVIATLIGFYIRNLTFMALGYTGLHALDSLMQGVDTAETIMKALIVLVAGGVLAWLYWRRSKGKLPDTMLDQKQDADSV